MALQRCRDCGSSNIYAPLRFGQPGEFYYEYDDQKFWGIRIDNLRVYTRFGKIGTTGATTIKDFRFYSEARDYVLKKRTEKEGKGYERIW